MPALVNADVSVLVNDGSKSFLNENSEIKMDFEIPTLEKFLTVREIALKVVKVLKINRALAVLSWIILVPPSVLQILENPPFFFPTLAAVAGVLIFSTIILANSFRAK